MPDLMSAASVRTLREAPADAGTPGYAMLLRAGYLRRVPGGHAWLPLGLRVLRNAARVVTAEVRLPEVRTPAGYDLAELGPVQQVGELSRPSAGSGLLRDRDVLVCAAVGAGHREGYERALDRLGIDWRLDEDGAFRADVPGAAEPVASCAACGWTAGTAAVPSPTRPAPFVEPGPVQELDTPDTPTIATLAAALGVPPSQTLKNVLVVTATGELVAVGVPGDREVDLDRVAAALGPVRLVTDADFAAHPELVKGYVGPGATRLVADRRIAPGTGWVTGANAPGRHARNVVAGRDFTVSAYADVVVVLDGDPCPRCGQPLRLGRAVTVARLGAVSTVDLTRVVAVAAEQHCDERGLAWPRELSPYDVQLVPVGRGDQPAHARDLAARLETAGLRTLVDDRDASAGVKLTDAELLGVPHVVVVGRRADEGVVEVRDRATGAAVESRMDDVVWAVTT